MLENRRVVFFTLLPSPYRVDFFNQLNKSVDLFVIYYKNEKLDLGWDNENLKHTYSCVFLDERNWRKRFCLVLSALKNDKDSIIVLGGYGEFIEIVTILYLKITRRKFILNSDGGFVTRGWLKNAVKYFLIRSASMWLSSGINTTKTLKYYGAKRSLIFEYPFSSILKEEVVKEPYSAHFKMALKKEVGLDENILYMIFVGQLIHRKGLDLLIDSLQHLNLENYKLLIVGEGSFLQNLLGRIESLGIENKVIFLGKKKKSEVIKYMKLSEFLILPSRDDIWGLVVNEAIACGLAIVCSDKVGSGYSLVNVGVNGFQFQIDDGGELTKCIELVIQSNINRMQSNSLLIAENYTIENMVKVHLKVFKEYDANYC